MPRPRRDGSEMTYDPRKHHRRSIRWFAYDYAQAGVWLEGRELKSHMNCRVDPPAS